jgi:hypothetical protein
MTEQEVFAAVDAANMPPPDDNLIMVERGKFLFIVNTASGKLPAPVSLAEWRAFKYCPVTELE